MKKVQEVQSLKKRLDVSLQKWNQKKQSVKENKTQKVQPAKKQTTTSVEVYLDVPSYKSPTQLNEAKSTSVLADIGNNLKSPPLLATQSFTQQSDDYTVQCTDLARVHYVRQTLSKCLYALLTNREESIQENKERSFTQRNKQRSQLIQISKVLNSTGQLVGDAEIDARVLHLSPDTDKCRSLISDENELIANKYNSVSLLLRSFISWKRYHYLTKVKRAKQQFSVVVEKSHENSSKNITMTEGETTIKEQPVKIGKQQESKLQSYQTKIEAPASRDPLQSLSRQLINKQARAFNEDLESVEDVAQESQAQMSIRKLRQSHISYNQSAQFTDDSYLQILSLPFSYNDRLKLKAFTGLRGYFDLQMTRGIVYRKISLLQKAFRSLVHSHQEKRSDSIRRQLKQILQRKSLKTCFQGLRRYMLQKQTIRKFQEKSSQKSAQNVISVFSENSSQNNDVYRRLDQLRKRQCFSNIRMFCLESRIQRVGNVQSYERMGYFWKRRVLKVLFNQVKVAKRVEKLRVISGRLNDSQVIRHFLKTWQIKSQFQEFKQKNYNRFLKRFFEPWLRASIRRVHDRQSFLIKRARNINARTLLRLKLYTKQCLDKKQRVLSLFQLRAKNLQSLAFKEGLLQYHRQARLKKNLHLVAGLFQAQRLYKDTLKQLKAYIKLKILGKQTQQKHSYITCLNTLQLWGNHTQHTRKLRKLTHKKDIRCKYLIIQRFKKLLAMKKFKRAKLNLVIAQSEKQLVYKSIVSLKKEMSRVNDQNDCVKRLIKMKALQKRKLVLKALLAHRNNSLRIKLIVTEIENRICLRLKFQIYTAFMFNRVLQSKVKRSLPFQEKLNNKMLENTFTFLRLYSIRKINQRLCIQSMKEIRNSRTYSQVLDVLVNYTKDHKKTSYLNQKALQKRRFQLSKKTMRAIFLWRLNKAQEAQLTLGICSQRRQNIFSLWFKYVHDELPKIKLAKIQCLKSRFTALKKYVKQMSLPRKHRRKISGITAQNVTHHYINQAIYWLYLHSQSRIHQKSKINLSDRIWKSRLFQKWVGVIPYFKRLNKNNIKAKKFRNRNLVYKGMEMLYVFSQIKVQQTQIIAVFRKRERERILSLCLASIIDFASEQKLRVLSFVELMCPVIQRSKALAFKKWMSAHAGMLKVEMADQLYLQRNGKEKKKLIWQTLRHETDKRIAKKRKNHKTSLQYRHFAMRTVFNKILMLRNIKLHEKLSISRIVVKSNKKCKWGVYAALKNYWQLSFQRRARSQRLKNLRRVRILHTALNALLINNSIAQKATLTRVKLCNKLVVETMNKWRRVYRFSNKISNMVTIAQHHKDKSFVRSVLPFMLRHGNIRKLSTDLNERRNNRLLRSVFTSFINQIMLRKILQALVIQSRQARMSKVFKEFRRQTRILIIHRELIATQVDLQNQEELAAIKRAVFFELVQLRFRRRANDCARHKFVFTQLKNTFQALRKITLKEKTLKFNFKQHQNEKIGRYLALWITAKELHHREKSAHNVLGFSTQNKVFKSLKDHKDKMHAIKEFRRVWAVKRLQFLGLRGFQQHNRISKFQDYVLMRISTKHDRVVQRDALQMFLQGCKESRLERSLQTYHNNRTASQVIKSWRSQLNLSNKVRLNLIKLRSTLKLNPSLGKPLLVLRNTLLNKAFQSLKEKAQRLRFLRKQTRLSAYAFYLRLLRKAFYGLRLNAADQYQNTKSRQIKRLVIKRRWFQKLKTAIANQKEARVKASHAAIFRFLSLQRKALKSIVIFFTQRCRLKIQNNFAMTLYYKQLLTKGYFSIKLYLIARRQSRRAPPSIVIQEDLAENEYDDADRNNSDRSYKNMKFEQQIRAKQQFLQDSRNNLQFNAEDLTLAPYSKTFMVQSPNKQQFKTPPNEISTLSNEFIISSTEMGPISSINYHKLKNLPQTMLQDQKKQSMSSSILIDEVPSCISATPPMSSPPTSNKQL